MATPIPAPGEGVCFVNETTGTEYCWDGEKWVSQGGHGGGSGGGGGTTNLGIDNRNSTTLDVTSSSGTDTTIPAATDSLAGLMTATDKGKIDSALQSGDDVVTKIVAGDNVTISPTSGAGEVTINATGGGDGPDLTDELAKEIADRIQGDLDVRYDLKADYQDQIDDLKNAPPGSMPEPAPNQGPHGRQTDTYGSSSWVRVPAQNEVLLRTGGLLTGGIEATSTEKNDKVFFNDNFSIHGDGAIYTQPGDINDAHQVPNLVTVLALIAAATSGDAPDLDGSSISRTGSIGTGLVYKFMNQGGNPSDGIVHGSSYNLQANSDLYFSFNPNGYNPGTDNIPYFRHENIEPGTVMYEASLINDERYDLTMGIYEPQWIGQKPTSGSLEDYNRTKSPANWIGNTDIKSITFTYYGIKVRTGKKPNIWHGSLTTGRLYRFMIPGFM